MSRSELFGLSLPVIGRAVLVWVVTWMFAAMLLTGSVTESPCPDPNISYRHEFRDWHMVGPWPIATDYVCRAEEK